MKLTKVISIAFVGMLLTSFFVFIEKSPASAANPVGSIQFNGNGTMKFSPGAPGSQNTTIEFWMKQTGTGNLQQTTHGRQRLGMSMFVHAAVPYSGFLAK